MKIALAYALALLLSVAVAAPACAQAPDPCATAPQSCATIINTRASASRRIANSAVDVTVGISATDREMRAVQQQLTANTGTLLGYLRRQKVERLTTENVNVTPETHYEKNAANRVVGYNGSTAVSFRTTPEKAPEILAGVLSNGANTIGSTSFVPTEEEIRAARRELSGEAVKSALAQAHAIAQAAEMKVVAVKSINVEDQGVVSPRPFARMAVAGMLKEDGPPPAIATEAGEQEISVAVDVTVAARP